MEPLMKRLPVLILLLMLGCLGEKLRAQTFREITLQTTGDFGVDSNWSDPTAAPPEDPPGAPFSVYANTWYYINNNRTATITAGSPNGSHFAVWHLFPG